MLTQLATMRGLSESAIVRQAIEHEATGGFMQEVESDASSLDALIQFALNRRKAGSDGEPLYLSREDVYSERLDRYGRLQP